MLMSLAFYVNVYVTNGTVLPEAATRELLVPCVRVRQFVRLREGVWPNRTDSWVWAAEPLLVRCAKTSAAKTPGKGASLLRVPLPRDSFTLFGQLASARS
jgi:hypothetical protein